MRDLSPRALLDPVPPDVPDAQPQDDNTKNKWIPKNLVRRVERSHSRLPGIRKVPFRALAIISFVVLVNILVWIAAAVVLVCSGFPIPFGTDGLS